MYILLVCMSIALAAATPSISIVFSEQTRSYAVQEFPVRYPEFAVYATYPIMCRTNITVVSYLIKSISRLSLTSNDPYACTSVPTKKSEIHPTMFHTSTACFYLERCSTDF